MATSKANILAKAGEKASRRRRTFSWVEDKCKLDVTLSRSPLLGVTRAWTYSDTRSYREEEAQLKHWYLSGTTFGSDTAVLTSATPDSILPEPGDGLQKQTRR